MTNVLRRNSYDQYQIQIVRRIHDHMLKHLEQQMTIQELSRQFHISSTFLRSCFRQLYGVPVHQYLLEQRMARAAQLLSSTDQTVLQIAGAVGYRSVSQFGAAFRSRYHMTPGQFRLTARKMSVSVSPGSKSE